MTQQTLNHAQQQAVEHIEGPLLVLAGAGSGKTRIVTARILHLLQIGVPVSEILAVTFTNKAAEEMKRRIFALSKAHILTCTFHSLCARILRESITHLGYTNDFVILDEDDSEKLLKQCFALLEIPSDKALIKNAKAYISQRKNAANRADDSTNPSLDSLYRVYQEQLHKNNSLDFDDLLFLCVQLFQKHQDILSVYQMRWRFILIDEYQDTNHAQYLLIKLLSATHHNVFAVGDPDQSIYSWRGADIHNILSFERDYEGATIVRLEQNYRSCNQILKAASALIERNANRLEKTLWSTRDEGDPIGLYIANNERQEADAVVAKLLSMHQQKGIPLRECALFYRTHFQSRNFEDALLREQIPYKMIGGLSFYQRKEIKDLLAFLRMALTDRDELSFFRTLNIPKRGLGLTTQEKLRIYLHQHKEGILTCCMQSAQGQLELSPKQRLALTEYVALIQALRNRVQARSSIQELLQAVIDMSHYLTYLKEDPETYLEKKENVDELLVKAFEWEQEKGQQEHLSSSLAVFLEELALQSNSEEQTSQDAVHLMTLHHSKGLEFSLVFLVGMEEDLFPHINAKDSSTLLEEERRLCYVGMTRAKDHLFLTASRYRCLFGSARVMHPSRFLKEIPETLLTTMIALSKENKNSFEVGSRIVHNDFGPGIIKRIYETSLGTTYDVFFDKLHSKKTLAAKYAKLKEYK